MTEGRAEAVRDDGSGRRAAVLKLAALVVLLAGSLLLARFTPLGDYLTREGIGRAVEALQGSPWAPVIFIAVYAGATAVAIPGSILTLAGGALFGVFWGTVYNSIAANIGANAAFLVARFLGRDGVVKLTGDRLEKLDRATREHGFKGLLTLRLIPVVPFNALNFGSGLTAISWPAYAVATLVGILPGTIVYTNFADALLAGSQDASREAFIRVVISGALLVLLSFLPTILRKLRVKLPGTTSAFLAVLLLMPAVGPAAAGTASLDRAPEVPPTVEGVEGVRWDVLQELPDHEAFTALLETVVRAPRVDYELLLERVDELDAYLDELADIEPAVLEAADREARLAFWINAYNACMLRLVADHYPIEESGGFFDRIKNAFADRPANSVWQIDDVFTREHCTVAGEDRSQDEIEHEIIRPMGDPRIHFAVNCAALSCPRLAPEAYTAREVDAQLDRQVRLFVDDPDHFRVERDGDEATIRLNKVLDWFGEDFGGKDGLRDFFRPYVDEATAELLRDPDTDIEFFDYDWTLNDVER